MALELGIDRRPVLPPSLWAKTAASAPETPAMQGDVRADVCIIGGGYTGLSTALHLKERDPSLSIVVLEAAEPGWGASGRNNGQVIPAMTRPDPTDMLREYGPDRGPLYAAMIRDSASLTFDMIRRHGIDCEAVQNGWVQPAHTPGRMKISEKRFPRVGRRWARRWLSMTVTPSGSWSAVRIMKAAGAMRPAAISTRWAMRAVWRAPRLRPAWLCMA
jgi:glycine/D-amino acid oxidase-like deaminating enzyme